MKKVLVALAPADLKVGRLLPWPIYTRSGQLVAAAGFCIENSAMQNRLLQASPVREVEKDDAEGTDVTQSAIAPAIAPQDPLKVLTNNAEAVLLTLSLPGDFEPRKLSVELYGKVPHQALIVSAPPLRTGQGWQTYEGLPVSVQVIVGKSICLFQSSLLRYAALPGGHLFLRYPTDVVVKPFRQSLRADVSIPASITTQDGQRVTAFITNISAGGCAIETEYLLGESGAHVDVAFRARAAGRAHTLNLAGELKGLKGKLSQKLTYGLQFSTDMDEATALILTTFVHENMAY